MARATTSPPRKPIAKRGVVLGEGPHPTVPPKPAPRPQSSEGNQKPGNEPEEDGNQVN